MKLVLYVGTIGFLFLLLPLSSPGRTTNPETLLKQIVLPEVDLPDTSVNDIFEFIISVSRDADPAKKGITVVLNLSQEDKEKKVSWRGRNKSMKTIVDDICLSADLDYSLRSNMIWITSKDRVREWFETRSYILSFSAAKGIRKEGTKAYLVKRGVEFPKEASCTFIKSSGKLVMKNTPKNHARAQKALAASQSRTPRKPRISRMKGGAFEGEEVYSMRGSRVDKALGAVNVSASARQTRYEKDMETYKAIRQQQAYAREQKRRGERLNRVIIPELELEETSVKDALELLEQAAFEYAKTSKSGEGSFQSVLRITPQEAAQSITFKANNIPLMQAIRAILGSVGLRYELHGTSLVVYSDNVG